MFESPQNSYVEIRMTYVMVLVSGTFGKCLNHKGRTLMNVIRAVINETSERSFVPSTM